jgi:hypothetical protein
MSAQKIIGAVFGCSRKALAVLSPARWAPTPNIPTIDEAGVPGLHLSLWNGIWAPKGTPHDIIIKLNGVVRSALANTEVKQRLLELGQIIPSSEQQTPQALAIYHKSEIEKWWPSSRPRTLRSTEISGEVPAGATMPIQPSTRTRHDKHGKNSTITANGALNKPPPMARHAVGTPVLCGMIAASVFSIFIIPLLYIIAERLRGRL